MEQEAKAELKRKHVVIVGGGPCGSLNACYMAKRGYKVDLYEARGDMRLNEDVQGKSVNLAVSCRGIEALKGVGLEEVATKVGVPMRARMIHLLNGKVYPIPYGKNDQRLLSVDRAKLNKELLTAAESCKNVTVHFNHKMVSCDVDNPSASFRRKDLSVVDVGCDLVLGCDGSYSAVRKQLQRGAFDYSQEYIPHAYKELTIPATKEGKWAMAVEYLHIWPRHEFMLIALPNQDQTYTLTLFMPVIKFDALIDGEKVLKFFYEVFPDAVPLIGEDRLLKDYFFLPPLKLITVKCTPYHHCDKVALFGDAAHAVVPFFGQGLNASLEDCLVFDELMSRLGGDISRALPEYSAVRCKDGHAIADLSKQNYIEMRSSVVSWWFLFRKKVDNLANFLFPTFFVPKYSMVAFTRIPYHQVILRSERQNKIINYSLAAAGTGVVLLSILLVRRNLQEGFALPAQVAEIREKLFSLL